MDSLCRFLPFLFFVWACGIEIGEAPLPAPPRPPSVSDSAEWAGGPKGGNWTDCKFVEERNANWCTIWDDGGDVWARTFFVSKATGEGVPDDRIAKAGFNGLLILLADGEVLEPLRRHQGENLDFAPIEPPRGESSESLEREQ